MNFMKKLTFAEAVKQQEENERRRKLQKIRSRSSLRRRQISSSEIIPNMNRLIKMIEDDSVQVLGTMKTVIHDVSHPDVVREMTEWSDDYNLNLVHYAILYKRPEVIQYLLRDSGVFPEDSQPHISPYAHLAAYLGYSVVVKLILTHRPGDFFTISHPEQNISLPPHLIKRFELDKYMKRAAENYEKIMDIIHVFHSRIKKHSLTGLSDDIPGLIGYLTDMCDRPGKVMASRSIILPSITRSKTKHPSTTQIYSAKPLTYKKLKELNLEHENFKDKTPLTLAIERGFIDTAISILENVEWRNEQENKNQQSLLYMATKAVSPEAIAMVLEKFNVTPQDFNAAVHDTIREYHPDCLIALLSYSHNKRRDMLDDYVNLYHMLYAHCLGADESKYELLPVMTKALMYCKMSVNDYRRIQPFPLYLLIADIFEMTNLTQIIHAFECFKCLLAGGANPFFDETHKPIPKGKNQKQYTQDIALENMYTSAIHCILENAQKSKKKMIDNPYTSIIVRNSMMLVLRNNKTKFSLNSTHLAMYFEKACYLGLDEYLIKRLLEYGLNPSFLINDKYPINFYFKGLFSFFRQSERVKSHEFYKKELMTLIIVCRAMQPVSLRKAVRIILNQYISNIPVEAVPITQYFLYLADNLMKEREALGENFDIN